MRQTKLIYFIKSILLAFYLIIYEVAGKLPISSRIVNGSNALEAEFPYAVSIRYQNYHDCGGSIVSEKWVLTAAHCIYEDFINVSNILYGTINSLNGNSSTKYTKNVISSVVHYEYEPYGIYPNDIALLEVEDHFLFGAFVAPVKLPVQNEKVPRNQDSILIGWGYSQTNGSVMAILQKVDITIFPDYICESYFTSNYSTCSHICAGIIGGGKGQCSGDSGGPLTVNGTIYGIVSWSDKPCAMTPGILTRVSSFVDWIQNVTSV